MMRCSRLIFDGRKHASNAAVEITQLGLMVLSARIRENLEHSLFENLGFQAREKINRFFTCLRQFFQNIGYM